MPVNTITLKNAADADVTFTLRSVDQRGRGIYIAPGASMAENMRLELEATDRGNTVRVVGKLSVPTAPSCDSGCTSPGWTEIGSFDMASVKVASSAAQADFLAMFRSFVGDSAVTSAYTTGV